MSAFKFYLLVLLCAVPMAAPVLAAGIDYNNDGRVSEEEFRNNAAREAREADANGNGVLGPGEYSLTNAEAAAMDTNGDGAIQIAEFQESLLKAFAMMDKNGDGVLDAQERKGK
jgi:Ca2+-binding EF-hand superfamily protein